MKAQLVSPKRITIVMHTGPDADALGTSLALGLFLSAEGHSVQVIAPTAYPDFLSWLPGADKVVVAETYTAEALEARIGDIDLLFCIDFSTASRLGLLEFILKKPGVIKVVIDHHTEPEDFADIFFWDPKAAASGEVLFQLIESLGQKNNLTTSIATCLYAALITDTNSFKNPNTTPKTHRIAAELMEHGVDTFGVQRLIYDNKSLNRLHFFGFAINQRLIVLPDLHTAYFVIQKEDCKRYHLKQGDTDGLIFHALSLQGIALAAVLQEKEDMVSISLRSVGELPVNAIAKQYFNGGGHRNAAGGISNLSLTETIDQFEQGLKQFMLNHTV
ncbi:DHH family phosphoesterase [Candidatus Cardinium hertigii]|uniref:DHH family phosphoesterase n=1 Tax=Candidatus Cardinium hertigii TaxID=247481 RepID=UPI001EF44BFE|nr:DHH family phosphoesterase [Candidatus Cardinium hertigii]